MLLDHSLRETIKFRDFARGLSCIILLSGLLFVGCQQAESPADSPLAVVDGASMTPHYWGEHWQTTCPDCDFKFPYHVALPKSNRVVCPNCGFREIVADAGTRQSLRQYRVEKLNKPHLNRWDVVAIQSTESSASGFLIKRIIGLPGEAISFARGNVLVNGQVATRSWPQIDEQKILVYDSQFEPTSLPRRRVRFSPPESWRDEAGVWSLRTESSVTEPVMIDYASWRCYLHADSREAIGPVEDVYFSDQALPRRLHTTDELSIAFTVAVSDDTEFTVARKYCGRQLECKFSWPVRSVFVFDLDAAEPKREIACFPLPHELPEEPITIEIATVDQKLAVRAGIEGLGRVHVSRGERPISEQVFQMRIQNGVGLRFGRLQIFRDVYWFDEPNNFTEDGKSTREFQVPDDCYFVMGDNVPVSRDSRDWKVPYVPRKSILGTVRPAAE
jgi:Signal peptidase, peptidase S26